MFNREDEVEESIRRTAEEAAKVEGYASLDVPWLSILPYDWEAEGDFA